MTEDHRGRAIYEYITQGKKDMLARHAALITSYILGLQIIEDGINGVRSEKLCEGVKEFSIMMLLKINRGLSVGEYEFTEHKKEIELLKYDWDVLESEEKSLEETRKLEIQKRVEINSGINTEKEPTFFANNEETKQ